jgi:hypothetical protein
MKNYICIEGKKYSLSIKAAKNILKTNKQLSVKDMIANREYKFEDNNLLHLV